MIRIVVGSVGVPGGRSVQRRFIRRRFPLRFFIRFVRFFYRLPRAFGRVSWFRN